jgi:uncharacterized protein (DUF2147 family)
LAFDIKRAIRLGGALMSRIAVFAILLTLAGAPAFARDPAIGVWQTEPDRKSLISHIEIRQCGEYICGRILKAFNTSGQEVSTPNIGKELFWDMVPHGDGGYSNGTAWVPLMNITVRASMQLAGSRLKVRACKGPVCETLSWSRVK